MSTRNRHSPWFHEGRYEAECEAALSRNVVHRRVECNAWGRPVCRITMYQDGTTTIENMDVAGRVVVD